MASRMYTVQSEEYYNVPEIGETGRLCKSAELSRVDKEEPY